MKNAEGRSARSDEHPIRDGGQDIRDRTFAFAVRVVRLCQHLDERPGVARTLSRQLLRSGTAIGANIEEAKAGQSRADFIAKCAIAQKEARETHYWLRLLTTTEVVPETRIADLLTEADELISILTAIIISAKQHAK
jgi:four helix bundle protein